MTNERPSDAPHDDRISTSLEAAGGVMEMLGKDEPPHCSCHASEKKSQTMATAAAVFSLGALALSIASIALPFLRKTDDVTFDAAAWAEFLSTIEERVEEPTPAPTTYVPTPATQKPITTAPVTTPEDTPAETPADPVAEEPTPTEVAANDAGTTPSADGTAEPTPADGSR